MNKLLKELEENATSIRYKKNIKIIEKDNKKYVIKKNDKKIKDIYDYLISRNFPNFPNYLNDKNDEYEITEYIEDIKIDDTERLEDMISLISILHNKTMYYKELDLDEIKKIYEEKSNEFIYLFNYYNDLNNMIEEEIYMNPANYYLILNMTKIYSILSQGKYYLDEWYKIVSNKKTIRFSLNHNNLEKEHIIENNNPYLISWNKADKGFVINDIYNIFINNYDNLNIETLLSIYESKCRLLDYEYLLLMSNLCTINKISLELDNLQKIKEVSRLIVYIDKVEEYISKNNSNKSYNNN